MNQKDTLLEVDLTKDEESWQEAVARSITEPFGFFHAAKYIQNGVEKVKKAYSGNGKSDDLSLDEYSAKDYPSVLYLPLYTLTAEEIFKGNILMFDVDFFNPKEVYVEEKGEASSKTYELTEEGKKYKQSDSKYKTMTDQEFAFHIALRYDLSKEDTRNLSQKGKDKVEKLKISEEDYKKYLKEVPTKVSELTSEELKSKNIKNYYYIDDDGNNIITSSENTAATLSGVISKWYNAIRNIAIVLMLSILLYIGIRMLISSVSSDKAKYKQMLADWLVGMCLLFFMHYIMAFSVTLTNKFVKIINSVSKGSYVVEFEDDANKELSNTVKGIAGESAITDDGKINWETNLMGKIRIAAEMRHGKVSFIGFSICFIVLVFYTVFFAFTYLKRVIYMAFLTIIAPFVAMTYPIDKINDGQAQGFNKWLKEYIFNLLIQPLHLLLYTMLVSSVFSFASENIWYMLVAIGFLIPAEKLLRNLFGFEKAATPPSLAGAAVGTGLVTSGLGKLLHKVPSGPQRNGKGDSNNRALDGDDDSKGSKIRFANDFDAPNALAAGLGAASYMKDGDDKNSSGKVKLLAKNKNMDPSKLKNARNGNAKLNSGKYSFKNVKNVKPLRSGSKSSGGSGSGSRKNANRRPKRIRRALSAGARRFTRGSGRKLRSMGKSLGKSTIRFASSAALGAAAGTIGVAAGIASGDVSNVLQYGAAGIGAGAYAGSKTADLAMNTVGYAKDKASNLKSTIDDTRDVMDREYYGEEEYRRRKHQKEVNEWKNNRSNKEEIEDAVGHETAKEMYDNGEINEYLDYGVSDTSDMIAMHKLKEQGIVSNNKEALAIQKYAEQIGDTKKLKPDDPEKWQNKIQKELQNIGYSESAAKRVSSKTYSKVEKFNKIRSEL